ncbi:uncharacterized protein LOC111002968 isoform X1 [Pieris rapae]|uniref:uncharacterized protein LOC111002968 isoform X1 n=1 Tax=Pieris rapae TaxID=64459 RepID=UPI001E280539|nr:uncharacterized protein LOC111002968 isoform X1 [Pieris rapae]XP_045489615.1 uncharacterized protein LOC111002968 isoform X1 [Pieris rapae]
MTPQQYCLRWKHHHSNVQSMFAQLLEKERFCDVTLYCSPNFATQLSKDMETNLRGVSLRAHRVVLAACSELLGTLLGAHEAQGEPVLVIDGAEPQHVRALLDYMYTGEMNVHHSQLAGLLKTAEELRIKGLTDIRWNNKDEPPDCSSGAVTTTQMKQSPEMCKVPGIIPDIDKNDKIRDRHSPDKIDKTTLDRKSPIRNNDEEKCHKNDFDDIEVTKEKFTLNGGPPPLIKLPVKEKFSPLKREQSDTDSQSPKRQRLISGNEQMDDDSLNNIKTEKDHAWQHGNLNISVERIVGWCATDAETGNWSRDGSDEEWGDAPTDIGSFLHTKLRVDGDNSADEESDDSASAMPEAPAHASSSSSTTSTSHLDMPKLTKGGVDPRFSDVVKLNDYLRHGRRPQFWEESYVKRVMDAVRMKELEMKQAAEILGVSYGTLYGRYRDVYGCINRPYSTIRYTEPTSKALDSLGGGVACARDKTGSIILKQTSRDFWQAKGPSEVLDRLQRGELNVEAAALVLGVNPTKLAAYVADPEVAGYTLPAYMPDITKLSEGKKDDANADIESAFDQSLRPRSYSRKDAVITKQIKKPPGNMEEDLSASSFETPFTPQPNQSNAWPSIRVASIESLRGGENTPSPSQLMKTRPDLTIIAAKRDKDET